jgi:hypothetical protein
MADRAQFQGGGPYQSRGDGAPSTGGLGLGPTIPQELSLNQAYHPRGGAEVNQDHAHADPTPAVGTRVTHRGLGEGTVVGHHQDPHTARITPRVQFAGEDASLAQGVAPNSVRPVGATPVDLYRGTQNAVSDVPRRLR